MIRVIGMHTLVGCVAMLVAVACASPTPTGGDRQREGRGLLRRGADEPDCALYQGVK